MLNPSKQDTLQQVSCFFIPKKQLLNLAHKSLSMLIIISPAKTQDFSIPKEEILHTYPLFVKESTLLIEELKRLNQEQISQLMEVSGNIAELNFQRFKSFHTPFTKKNAKQALLAFKGDVYTDIDTDSYSNKDFDFAQQHLRILSGLYGLLQPLDLIQPYRLEMKTKLKNPKGKDLYEFWGNKISIQLNKSLSKHKENILVNLASNEYFKAINLQSLNAKVITPTFKEYKNGVYKIVAIHAKRARGMMTNFIIKNKITHAETLKTFREANYEFAANLSNEQEWVFIR
jgi:uncharacterized protein